MESGGGVTGRLRAAARTWPIVGSALVASTTQILRGLSCGHDFDFHLVSWLEAQRGWAQGVLYPHWAQSPNWGAGEPRFVFYPPLTWMLGALLGKITKWEWAPLLLIFLCLCASGQATRALARRWMPEPAATLAGALATCLPYTLFTAYERGAFGELAGAVFVPLLLLFALRTGDGPAGSTMRTALDGSAAPLALVVAAGWLTNAPAGVMLSYLLAFVALVAAVMQRAWCPVVRAAVGVALGLGLAALYLVPAAWEQRWIAIEQANDVGMRIEDSWLFARHANPDFEFHDQVLLTASAIVVFTVVSAAVGYLVAWRRGKLSTATRAWWLPIALIVPVVLVAQFPVSGWAWHLLPKLGFLQFPWRWLMVLGTPTVLLLAAATPLGSRRARIWSSMGWTVAVLAMTCASTLFFFQNCDEEDNSLNQVAVFRAGTGVEGTDEYAPKGAENDLVAAGLPQGCMVDDPRTVLGQKGLDGILVWSPEQASCRQVVAASLWETEHKVLHLSASEAGYLVLRLRRYPAWRVTVNGKELDEMDKPLPERADGLLPVPVAAGDSTVEVAWKTTPDVRWGRALSAVTLLLLVLLWAFERGGVLRFTLRARIGSRSRLS